MALSFLRTALLYIIVVLGLRIMGKRQIGEMQPSELVVAIMISDLAAIPMQDTGISLFSGIIPILTLIVMEILLKQKVPQTCNRKTQCNNSQRQAFKGGNAKDTV